MNLYNTLPTAVVVVVVLTVDVTVDVEMLLIYPVKQVGAFLCSQENYRRIYF